MKYPIGIQNFGEIRRGGYVYVDIERHTTDGRMDILMQTPDYIYIMELKIDQSADVALQQIEEKKYAAAFDGDQRKLFKIGLSFSSETRRVSEWKIDIQAK